MSASSEMRLVLENVGDALFTVDAHGILGTERSRASERFFGPVPASGSVCEWLAATDAAAAAWLDVSLGALWDDVLPIELALEQLPPSMTDRKRHFSLKYTPIYAQSGVLRSVLVVAADVTSMVEQRRSDGVQRDVVAALRHVVSDRAGFEDLVSEVRKLFLRMTASADAIEIKRVLHTLKGAFATFELQALAAQAHDMETMIGLRERRPSDDEIGELSGSWEIVDRATRSVLDLLRSRVAVPDAVLVGLASDAQAIGGSDLAARIRSLRCQTVHTRLARLADYARAVADRLGKPNLEVVCACDDARLPPEPWLPFWSALVHTVRNAVDHGIESPDDRVRAGKSPHGTLTLTARAQRQSFAVEVRDDGSGIDWERVRASANKVGIAAVTAEDLEQVLFLDCVSTATEETDISGRGIGMGAVREACEALGGRVVVRSVPSNGTTIRFEFPPADV